MATEINATELQKVCLVRAHQGDYWAIDRRRFQAMLNAPLVIAASEEEIEARACPRKIGYYSLDGEPIQSAAPMIDKSQQVIAVLPLAGTITHRGSFWGGTSVVKWEAAFRELVNSPQVGAIVVDIDSPGGSVAGIAELSETIRAARKSKLIVGVANTFTASAAYYLGAQLKELYITPSGEIGSIGVWSLHVDYSEMLAKEGIKPTFIFAAPYKVEGNFYEPLSDEGKAAEQAIVDDYYNAFLEAVAKGRGVSVAKVKKDFGEGRMVRPAAAKAAGMVDDEMTFDQVIRMVGKRLAGIAKGKAAVDARRRELELLEM